MATYRNPVIRGYNPDPSIVRVGEDFYLVTSSFEFFPGVPIYHSKNLCDWELISYCLTRDSQLPLQGARNSGGIYAPTIRYHDGMFYMITTNVTSGGNFIVHTKDIRGEWSEPATIAHKGIDPSLLFDDDGRVYFCGTGKDGIALYEINPMTGELLSEMRTISGGMGGKCPEAPHMYKIHGWYYLMIAEGGTEYGHMETIFRSKTPYGPYESCPNNPILSHKDYMGSPIQATGHADLVEDLNGNWWMVALGIRPLGFTMLHNLGRETFLSPVVWDEELWPVVGDKGRIALTMEGPLPAPTKGLSDDFKDDFSDDTLNPEWNFVRNPVPERYQLSSNGLLLIAGDETLDDEVPTLVAVRQKDFCLRAEAAIDCAPSTGRAGLTAYYNKDYHYEISVTHEDPRVLVQLHGTVHGMHFLIAEAKIRPFENPIEFCLKADRERYTFSYRSAGEWVKLGHGPTAALCTEGTMMMTFTGSYIGVFASKTSACVKQFSCQYTIEP